MDMNLLLDAIADRVAQRVAEQVPAPMAAEARTAIDPLRPYTADEVAAFLGLNSRKRVHDIPEFDLPRVRHGKSVRFIGINLIAYALGCSPVDTARLFDEIRQDFIRSAQPTRVQHIGRPGRVRIQ